MKFNKELTIKIAKIVGLILTIGIFLVSLYSFISAFKKTDNAVKIVEPKDTQEVINDKKDTNNLFDKDGKKPIIVLFYTDWCSYCQRFLPIFEDVSKEYSKKYDFVKINAEDSNNRETVDDYTIGGFPTVFIVDPKIDNRIMINNTLYLDVEKFKQELDRYVRIRKLINFDEKNK